MTDLLPLIVAKYNYWLYVILMMIGLYAMIAKKYFNKETGGYEYFSNCHYSFLCIHWI